MVLWYLQEMVYKTSSCLFRIRITRCYVRKMLGLAIRFGS